MTNNKAHQEGEPIGDLFGRTVASVQTSLKDNPGVGAVDIAVHFKSVDIESKSKGFVIFSKNKQSESSIEIKLATRVYPTTGEIETTSQSTIRSTTNIKKRDISTNPSPPEQPIGYGD